MAGVKTLQQDVETCSLRSGRPPEDVMPPIMVIFRANMVVLLIIPSGSRKWNHKHGFDTWGFPNSWMVYFMEKPIKMDDLGVPLF